MVRKSAAALVDNRVQEAVEMAEIEAEVRGELADTAIELQDDKTKALIERMVAELRKEVTGRIVVGDKAGMISREALDANLRFIATEILRDLQVFDIRVGTYILPPGLCALCGVEL